MSIIFHNPFQKVIDAAIKVYPELECIIQFDPRLECPPYGETWWSSEVNEIPVISISSELTIENSLEILAHELAHVIAGLEADHNDEWKHIFSKIHRQYNEDNEFYEEGETK